MDPTTPDPNYDQMTNEELIAEVRKFSYYGLHQRNEPFKTIYHYAWTGAGHDDWYGVPLGWTDSDVLERFRVHLRQLRDQLGATPDSPAYGRINVPSDLFSTLERALALHPAPNGPHRAGPGQLLLDGALIGSRDLS